MRKSAAASGFLLLALVAWGGPAPAASSAWASGEGASVRLVTAGPPGADGTLRGTLDIALEPGWRTYWRDPGSAGVPPSLDVSRSTNVLSATLGFPAPERHDDGYGAWAGYSMPVALPVTFRLVDPKATGTIEADVFLGICRDICIPFAATLAVDVSGGDDPEDPVLVEAAFAALPRPASAGFGVAPAAREGDRLVLHATMPAGAGAPPILFLAGVEGYAFGVPEASRAGRAWRFSVPLLEAQAMGGAAQIPYTLEAGGEAVSGTFSMP